MTLPVSLMTHTYHEPMLFRKLLKHYFLFVLSQMLPPPPLVPENHFTADDSFNYHVFEFPTLNQLRPWKVMEKMQNLYSIAPLNQLWKRLLICIPSVCINGANSPTVPGRKWRNNYRRVSIKTNADRKIMNKTYYNPIASSKELLNSLAQL